ncbi:hypothetical protein METBIDRAFT_77436 [Metschnikowia bicuspidata var. bicuspidata NRRL YB-4993]|uniref:Pre-rRNA-processing protein ESF2 n=1 Tax=Metschnikowia bicuspidata var. bicuspidata NRRL YB-4993 TaxID=869754 RepID=A0A1A0HD80_9ASCO|nr:hypothetical protein METBIDRAFT_77436 [Metschnikowia bicuspidata var. bicuspidata NRRL YB-4993]OBA21888.1 hypothetical protein METBIDRAFT_77436 [Metschnikowia bicuspidata var. bicuspidata NRRL YB-4993]
MTSYAIPSAHTTDTKITFIPVFTSERLVSLDDDFSSDDEEQSIFQTTKKKADHRFEAQQDSESDALDAEDEPESVSKTESGPKPKLDETSAMVEEQHSRANKLKRLTPEQLAKEQKKIKRTGVCYLSSIPPYMKPVKLRSVLSKFGKLDRIFLKPEDPTSYHRRVKYGGNKKKRFTEGWVEFTKKTDAKLCAETMNGNILGGKKSSYYHDDIINIKYLPGFKWFDLTQQISKENEIRQAKLALEISQQAKLDKSFVNNVERSKHYERKRKAQGDDVEEPKFKRDFSQHAIASTRADAKQKFKKEKNSDNLESVLSKVF